VLLGLLLAIPLAWGTASLAAGRLLARLGLLRTPEEALPPPVVADARAMRVEYLQ
jgi:membrane glycosyltransferase